MRIGGYQPLSLSDFPGKCCAVIFTQGCMFRCAYCHNPELLPPVSAGMLDLETVIARIERDRACLDGVCVTGGEPTLQSDLGAVLQRIAELGLAIKLDTNGVNPRALGTLLDAGAIDYVAMDVKHSFARYPEVTGIRSAAAGLRVRESMSVLGASRVPHEFRTTVWGKTHTTEDLVAIAVSLPIGSTYALQELRLTVTLEPGLDPGPPVDLHAAAEAITAHRPDLHLNVRSSS